MSGEKYPAATGGGCLLLYVRGAGVAAGDGDGDVVEPASSMEEGDHSGIGEHAAAGVRALGECAGGGPAAAGGIAAGPGGGEM